ncbi:phage tail protein [Blautia producta]|nr:phage tail protein [Blautia producta]
MTGKENKVKYNIKNVHVAKQTETVAAEGTTYEYAAPKNIPGAVSISLDAEGEISTFYADGIAYFVASANNGYSGDLEMAIIPSWFRVEILNETLDNNKVLVENANNSTNPFALLFEFDGDVKAIRRCLYNCTCTRPSIESETKEETVEPGTETLSITNSPRTDGLVKAQTGPDTAENTYADWYKNVYVPTVAAPAQITGK